MLQDYLDIDPEEFIDVRFWESLANKLDVPFVPCEHIPRYFFWDKIKSPTIHTNASPAKSVLISAYSDYTICNQSDYHPNKDLIKLAQRCNWEMAMGKTEQYSAMDIGPACNVEYSRPIHAYSSKMDSMTCGTFPSVPTRVKWFCTNLNISHPTAELIPFGLNDDGPGLGMLPNFRGREKKHFLYVNFQDNTNERVVLKQYYKNCPWVTLRDTANLPIEQFLAEVAEHKYVLSPFGNGMDCYRNYEAMYLGSIPVIKNGNNFYNNLSRLGLPIVGVPDMIPCVELLASLEETYPLVVNSPFVSFEKLTKSYWENRITNAL